MMQFVLNARLKLAMYCAAALLAASVLYWVPSHQVARAQSGDSAAPEGGPSSTETPTASTGEETPAAKKPSKSIDIFQLALAGGIFMIPIFGMSILAATMTIER